MLSGCRNEGLSNRMLGRLLKGRRKGQYLLLAQVGVSIDRDDPGTPVRECSSLIKDERVDTRYRLERFSALDQHAEMRCA